MNAASAEEGNEPRVHIEGNARDQSRVYIAGRDLYQTTYPSPPPVTAPRTLPRDVAAFTGREGELRQLLQMAKGRQTRVVAIHTVDGMPGVGKTALVTRAAHLLADQFPDGQMFVDLYGHTPGQPSADPADVLAVLLGGIGVAPQYLPDTLQGRSALWRNRLAGKRMLLVLDNAVGAAQVEPILPAADGCLVLVTSRRRLLSLDGTRPLSLEPLPPAEAAALFTRIARRSPGALEADVIAETVRLCGFLPLAITLLGARLTHHPAWGLAPFLDAFTSAQDRLGELEAGDRAVRAAFGLSYRVLPADRQRLFRRLGLHAGPDIDVYASAALDDVPLQAARHQMEALYVDHLIESPSPFRYRLHDLLRAYAQTLSEDDSPADRAQVTERLLVYYQYAAQRADQQLTTTPQKVAAHFLEPFCAPSVTNREQALIWMRTERPNLLACIKQSSTGRHVAYAAALTHAIAAFLHHEGPWPQAVDLHRAAAAMVHREDDGKEADALRDLGRALQLSGDYANASSTFGEALKLFRGLNNALGEANTLRDLGWVKQVTGDYVAAEPVLMQALKLYRAERSHLGEANTRRTLGWVRQLTGDYAAASTQLELALNLYRALDDLPGVANTLHDLGRLRRSTGEYLPAAELLEQALILFRSSDSRLGEANTLWALSRVREMTGDYSSATGMLERALELYRALSAPIGEAHALRNLGQLRQLTGDYVAASAVLDEAMNLFLTLGARHGQANTLRTIGRVRQLTGEHAAAAAALDEALALYRVLGARHGEAHTLRTLGDLRRGTGDFLTAAELLKLALSLFREVGDPQGEAEALNSMGRLLAVTAGPDQALEVHLQALQLARRVQSPLDEADALDGIAHCEERCGSSNPALAHLREAVAIYTRIGASEAASAADRLAHIESVQPPGSATSEETDH